MPVLFNAFRGTMGAFDGAAGAALREGDIPSRPFIGMEPVGIDVHYFENYCTECDWQTSTEEHDSRSEVSNEAVAHYVESGHPIDSRSITFPAP